MKQIIRDWSFGLLVSYYFMLAFVCVVAGFSLVLGVYYTLAILGWNVPYYVFISTSILYVILFCPFATDADLVFNAMLKPSRESGVDAAAKFFAPRPSERGAPQWDDRIPRRL